MTSITPDYRSRDVALPASATLHADEAVYFGIRLTAWVKIVSIAVLFTCLFWPNLRRLWDKTNPFTGEDNWKHAIFVPLLGLYYLYINREQLAAAKVQATWTGLPILIFGILLFGYAIWPLQNDWFKDLGMVVTLFGVVTLLCGWEVMKTAWFPIAFLICALPWPGLFYSMLAGPLQEFAARVAVRLMLFIGVGSGQFGTKIFVEGKDHAIHTLNVAEACAGLRSLMTFISIAAAVAFLSYRALWQKCIMVFSAIPIAIFCNTMRVTVQGVLSRYASPQWAEGAAHGFVGLVMMIPAFFLILLVGWILQNIFIEEVTDKKSLRQANSGSSRRTSPGGQLAGSVARVPAAGAVSGRSEGGQAAPLPRATVKAIAATRPPGGRAAPVRPAMISPGQQMTPRPAAIPPSTVPRAPAAPRTPPAARPVQGIPASPASGSASSRRPPVAPSPGTTGESPAPAKPPAGLPPRPRMTPSQTSRPVRPKEETNP